MPKRWIAIVNRTEARIFSEKPFKRIGQLKNLLGRAKNREMTTDRPNLNRSNFGGAKGIHGTSGEKSPHEDAAVMFAKRLSEYFRKAHATNRFDTLTIVAEPKMLGRVKSEFHKTMRSCTEWVGKDFGHASNVEIPRLLGIKVSARV
jgi:protein required for attachment to host cells